MIVIPIPDKSNPGRSYVRINDVPCFFPRGLPTPPAGVEVEIMITGVHYFLNDDGSQDKTRPKQLFIRVVTPYYQAVDYDGFVCVTENHVRGAAITRDPEGRLYTLIPGRTNARIEDVEGFPGRAYVSKRNLGWNILRIEGVASLQDLECHEFFRNIAV